MESQTENQSHLPVMVNEVLTALDCHKGTLLPTKKIYLDCTVGMGGHTEAILNASAPSGKVIGIDRDRQALQIAEKRLKHLKDRVTLRKGTFRDLRNIVSDLGYEGVDGILFDFGVSSFQLDTADRGFSFQKPGPLDMRMDTETGETASDLINRLSENELVELIRTFGEERWAMRIALGIVDFRKVKGPITRTEELENIVWQATPARFRHGRTHPATRTFQAIRMVVNREIEQIEAGITTAVHLLNRGGRLVVISFHSLEDRYVKHAFKKLSSKNKGQKEPEYINLYKKPLRAGLEENTSNRRARSAKLRALQRAA